MKRIIVISLILVFAVSAWAFKIGDIGMDGGMRVGGYSEIFTPTTVIDAGPSSFTFIDRTAFTFIDRTAFTFIDRGEE